MSKNGIPAAAAVDTHDLRMIGLEAVSQQSMAWAPGAEYCTLVFYNPDTGEVRGVDVPCGTRPDTEELRNFYCVYECQSADPQFIADVCYDEWLHDHYEDFCDDWDLQIALGQLW